MSKNHPVDAASPEAQIAAQFVRARLEASIFTQYPGVPPEDIAGAYRCQDIALAGWPQSIGGWKVTAPFSPAWQAQYGEERMIGPIFVPNMRSAVAEQVVDCPVFAGGFCAFEPEIMIQVSRDAPQDKFDWTAEEAIAMVGEIYLGAEIASSPLKGLLTVGVTAVASDFGANFGIVTGSAIRQWRSLDEVAVQCFLDGKLDGQGVTSLRATVLPAFAFVLGKAARRGRPLREGAMISTGTITRAHHVLPGQTIRFAYADLGEVSCRAVVAAPRALT